MSKNAIDYVLDQFNQAERQQPAEAEKPAPTKRAKRAKRKAKA